MTADRTFPPAAADAQGPAAPSDGSTSQERAQGEASDPAEAPGRRFLFHPASPWKAAMTSRLPRVVPARLPLPLTVRGLKQYSVGNSGNLVHQEAPQTILMYNRTHSACFNLGWACRHMGEQRFRRVIQADYDVVCLSMANFIRRNNDMDYFGRAVELIDKPVIVFGAGLQNDIADPDRELHPTLLQALRALGDRARLFATRGEQTRDWLRRHGYGAPEALGCPSLYVFPGNMVRALSGLPRALDRIADARIATAGHLNQARAKGARAVAVPGAEAAFMQRGAGLLSRFARPSQVTYVFQDEIYEFDGLGDEPIYDSATGWFDADRLNRYLFGEQAGARGLGRYAFFGNTPQWRSVLAAGHDLYLGDRLHGGVIAMQAGVPAVILSEDVRVSEILALYGLPDIRPSALPEGAPIEAAVAEIYARDFDLRRTLGLYLERLDRFVAALEAVELRPTRHFMLDVERARALAAPHLG